MATFPIPAKYINTGSLPGQIPVRDERGGILGVPVIYSRTLTDEIAKLVREQVPSGFLRGGKLLGSLTGSPNTVRFDGTEDAVEVVIDGYRLQLFANDSFTVTLNEAPVSGTQDDLLFVEAWFVTAKNGGRTIEWRLRYVSDVDFASYPDGLGDPKITAHGAENTAHAGATFALGNQKLVYSLRDPGLYLAAISASASDPIAETGVDGQTYYVVYGLPLARIKRLNSTAYNPLTNPDGGSPYTVGGVSTRPDGLWYDVVGDRQLIDLRHQTAFRYEPEHLLNQTLYQQLTNTLGQQDRINQLTLDNRGQRGYFADRATTQLLSLALNLVRNSHFETASNVAQIAEYWTRYTAEGSTVTGQFGLVSEPAAGQNIQRNVGVNSEPFGLKRTLAKGFNSKQFTVRLRYYPTVAQCEAGTSLNLVIHRSGADPLTDEPLATITSGDLKSQEDQSYELTALITSDSFETSLDLYLYLVGGRALVVVEYLDIKADSRLTDVIKLGGGSTFTLPRSAALVDANANFDLSVEGVPLRIYRNDGQTLSYGGLTALDQDGNLDVQLTGVPANMDLRVVVPITYAAGAGYTGLLGTPSSAQEAAGFVGLVASDESVTTLGATAVGLAIPSGFTVAAYNPESTIKGVVATVPLPGNNGKTYTLAATYFGRKALLPLNAYLVEDGQDVAQTVDSVAIDENGLISLTLNAQVSAGKTLKVEVALDAPLVVWDRYLNGQVQLAETRALTTAIENATEIYISVPGLALGKLESIVSTAVFIDGVQVTPASFTAGSLETPSPFIRVVFNQAQTGILKVVVLVQFELDQNRWLNVAYLTPVLPDVTPDNLDASVTLLSNPVLLVHTKGTGQRDSAGSFTDLPFVQDETLTGGPVVLSQNTTATQSAFFNLPLTVNILKGLPLFAGRTLQLSDLTDTSFELEGPQLTDAQVHRTAAALLVDYQGRVLLLLLEQNRSDSRIRLTGQASLKLFEPNGRPLKILASY